MSEEDSKTLWCGNLPEQATEEILYELFLQAGPLQKVRIPKDRDGRQKSFAFLTYWHEVSVPYAIQLLQGTALFHKTLSLQCRAPMVKLPPPIRCWGPENQQINETNYVADTSFNSSHQLLDLDTSAREEPHGFTPSHRRFNDSDDNLVLASLQGNWSHRHHPYSRVQDRKTPNRPSYMTGYKNSKQHGNSWRDRRSSHKKGSGYSHRD